MNSGRKDYIYNFRYVRNDVDDIYVGHFKQKRKLSFNKDKMDINETRRQTNLQLKI